VPIRVSSIGADEFVLRNQEIAHVCSRTHTLAESKLPGLDVPTEYARQPGEWLKVQGVFDRAGAKTFFDRFRERFARIRIGATSMTYLKQVAAPVGAFLGLALLVSVLAAPYFREAERHAPVRQETRLAQSVPHVQ
jgi:hypothetical protein